LVDDEDAARQVAEEDVVRDVAPLDEREVLVDDGDAGAARLARVVEGARLAVEVDLAGVGADGAAERLDERGLARAVVAHEREDLALVDLEADVRHGPHVPERLRQRMCFEDRGLRGQGVPTVRRFTRFLSTIHNER